MAEKRTILVTHVLTCVDHMMDEKNRPILSYEVMTDDGRLTLLLTVPAAEFLRKKPERLPLDLGPTPGFQQIP
jgi:hypothetical protein